MEGTCGFRGACGLGRACGLGGACVGDDTLGYNCVFVGGGGASLLCGWLD